MKKLVFCLVIIVFFTSSISNRAFALTAEEVREQINDANTQIEALDKEIKQFQSQIAKTGAEANTLANHIKELTLTRNKLVKEKEQIQKKITATGLVIKTLSGDIEEKVDSISLTQKSLAQTISDLNQNDNTLAVERILVLDNFSEFSREYNDKLTLNDKIREYIDKLSEEREELITTKVKKEGEQQNLNTLKKDLIQKEQVVAVTKKEKDTLLLETKNKEAEYKKLLAEREKIKKAFETALEDYEAQLKYILNPKLLPKEGSGVLAWPLSSILVTSQYGARWGSFHYGIDFRAAVGTKVMAMATGEVLGTGDTDIACKGASFGKWVFIKYNNGLSSTFGHLSVISAQVGDEVKSGDIVGLSGNTGSSTGPHLHVAVYASDGVNVDTVPSKSCGGKTFTQPIAATKAYLNPALYLPKITTSMIKK
jgi:murein DD-endopeptidase MepM/ murein hydrolase activator NlpD